MTTQTQNKRVDLPADLIEQVDAARGATPRADWLAQAAEEKLVSPLPDSSPVVDLDETPERATIRSRGALHELRHLDEMGIVEQQRLNRDGREFSNLFQSDEELTDDQADRLEFLQDRIFHQVLDAPKEERDAFKSADRTRVVLAFTYAPARQQLAAVMALLNQQNGSDSTS